MKLKRLIFALGVAITYMLIYYLRQALNEEEDINMMQAEHLSQSTQSKRILASSNLMTSSCADQEDLASQPYNEDYQTAIDNMKNLRGDNKALDAMATNQNWNSYLDSLPAVYVGLLIFAIIALIIFIVEFMQVFCQSCMTCFKRDIEKEPYANWSIGCSIVSSVVTTIILFGFSIAGLSTNKTLIQSMNRGICQSLTMTNDLVYGKMEYNWLGIDSIETKLRNIGNELVNTSNQYLTPFLSTTYLSEITLLHTDISTIQSLSTYVVTLPNPLRSSNPKQVQPDIIFILGTQAVLDQTKVVGSLEWEYQTKSALQTNLLVKIRDSSAVLGTQATSIKSQFDDGSAKVNSFKTKILNFKSLVEKQMDNAKTSGLFVYNAGNAIYGITIAFGLLGLLSITLVLWCKLSFVKYGIYVTWIIISIMSVLSFVAALYGYTEAVGLMENCEGIQYLATDSDKFDKYINFIGTPELKTCFFGNGNLSTQFGLEDPFLKINEVKSDLNNIDNKKSLFEAALNTRYIYNWEKELSSYMQYQKEAVQISSASGFQKYDLPSQTLDELNSWSNYEYQTLDGRQNAQFSLSCGAFSRDTIVYQATQCQTAVCQNVSPISQPCCIVLEDNTFTSSFIQTRMNMIVSSCSNLNDYKTNYQNNFDSLSTYVKGLKQILSSQVKPKFDAFLNDSTAYLSKINSLYSTINTTFRTNTANLISMVTDQTVGIQNILQCKFLASDFKNMHQGLCHSYMVRMYNSSVVLIVVSCFSLIAQIAYFFTTTRIIDFVERNRVQRFIVSRQKPIIDPEKYRSHPLHDQSINQNQSYLNQSAYQPALQHDQSVDYLNNSVQHPQEIELSKMNGTKPVKQGLLENFAQKNNNGMVSNQKANQINALPPPSNISGNNNGDKPVLYQPKLASIINKNGFSAVKPSLNQSNQNSASAVGKQNQVGNNGMNSRFNNQFDDNDDDDDADEEGLNKMIRNNNSKFGIPVGNNVIR